MTEEDWFRFIAPGEPQLLRITRLSESLCPHINARNSRVFLRHDYALKLLHKHRFKPHHFPMLPITIEHGRAICDRQRHLTFFLPERVVFGTWFQAPIKANQEGEQIFVCTFHKQDAREVERICRRHEILRPETR